MVEKMAIATSIATQASVNKHIKMTKKPKTYEINSSTVEVGEHLTQNYKTSHMETVDNVTKKRQKKKKEIGSSSSDASSKRNPMFDIEELKKVLAVAKADEKIRKQLQKQTNLKRGKLKKTVDIPHSDKDKLVKNGNKRSMPESYFESEIPKENKLKKSKKRTLADSESFIENYVKPMKNPKKNESPCEMLENGTVAAVRYSGKKNSESQEKERRKKKTKRKEDYTGIVPDRYKQEPQKGKKHLNEAETNELAFRITHNKTGRKESIKKEERSAVHGDVEIEISEKQQGYGKSVSDNLFSTLEDKVSASTSSKLKKYYKNTVTNVSEGPTIAKMINRVKTARFRYLNERMESSTGKDAQFLFKNDYIAYRDYHEGYQLQVAKWILDPLDVMLNEIKVLSKNKVIADFGCGEARLAKTLIERTVHSFDLVALNERVTECEMSNVPLDNSVVDICIFCLSLMGTNLGNYILEANRVLREGGLLKIAEVENRFESVDGFVKLLVQYGFKLINKHRGQETQNKMSEVSEQEQDMFVFLNFKKTEDVKRGDKKLPHLVLKPCVYKKR